jgi:hypothetical protein
VIPLALRLMEFPPDENRHAPRMAPQKRTQAMDTEIATEKLRDAFERGRETGKLEAEQTFAARFAEEKRMFDQQLKTLRENWTEDQAERISRHMTDALAEIETRLAGSVAKVLEPFLADAVKQKAVGDFSAAVRQALKDNPEPALQMTGPQDLLDAIAAQLGPLAKTIEFSASQSCTVSARLGPTVFETELAHWLTALKEASP